MPGAIDEVLARLTAASADPSGFDSAGYETALTDGCAAALAVELECRRLLRALCDPAAGDRSPAQVEDVRRRLTEQMETLAELRGRIRILRRWAGVAGATRDPGERP